MSESEKKTVEVVINTLNSVSVMGKANLDMQLGCILALEKLLAQGSEDNG